MSTNNKKDNVIYASLFISIIALVLGVFWNPVLKNQNFTKDALVKIQEAKKVNICYGVYPPSTILDSKTNELSGYDIEMARLIFSQIDVEPVFIEQSWGNMVTALQSGRCDMSLALLAQISRAASVSFSEPFYYLGDGALVKKGDTRFKSIDDINNSSVRVVVANGESGHNYAKSNLKNAKLVVIDIEGSDLSRIFSEVASGRADVAVTDSGTIKKYVDAHPEFIDLFKDSPLGLNPVGMAMRHSDKDLLQFIDTSIKALKADGTIEGLQKKYHAGTITEVKSYKIIE